MRASPPRRFRVPFPALLGLALAASAARAHDFWIEPSSYRPAVGTVVGLSLRVGENFKGEPVPRQAERIERFVLAGPGGVQAAVGSEGDDPAGSARIVAPGGYVAGYRSREAFIELEAEKFEAYLAEEGLERISRLRAERGESSKPGREAYSRCAKSLVEAGSVGSGFDHTLGFPFEIVPVRNPYALRGGGEMPVILLHGGQPLEGALVVVLRKGDPAFRRTARTDADGRAVFKLPKAGTYLVKSVHMTPAPPDAESDWQSLWASLTFRIPESK